MVNFKQQYVLVNNSKNLEVKLMSLKATCLNCVCKKICKDFDLAERAMRGVWIPSLAHHEEVVDIDQTKKRDKMRNEVFQAMASPCGMYNDRIEKTISKL